jgi:hypothetical protein
MRRGTGAQCDEFGAPGARIEPTEMTAALRGEPDTAIEGRRHIVDAGALWCVEWPGLQRCGRR